MNPTKQGKRNPLQKPAKLRVKMPLKAIFLKYDFNKNN